MRDILCCSIESECFINTVQSQMLIYIFFAGTLFFFKVKGSSYSKMIEL